nr:MAG TPA: hypothetical protein [Bacteriophage sp.]
MNFSIVLSSLFPVLFPALNSNPLLSLLSKLLC